MTAFLTTIADDVERCRRSLQYREPITITAAVAGAIRVMTGVISAIEPVPSAAPVWKITIDEKPA